METIKFFSLSKQHALIKKEVFKKFEELYDSGKMSAGKEVELFEEKFANYCGQKYCVLLNSGTAALWIIGKYLYKDGENVYVPANSFVATASALSLARNQEVKFIDTDSTCNISLDGIKYLCQDRDLIVPVSLYGFPVDLEKIKELKPNCTILHDCAQAVGAKLRNKMITSYGDYHIVSFYITKNLSTSTSESGCILTSDEKLYNFAKEMRNHGRNSVSNYDHFSLGLNFRSCELSAAILNIKLKYYPEWLDERIGIANYYLKLLNQFNCSNIQLPTINSDNKNVWHLFPVFVKNRDLVRAKLLEKGIEVNCQYPKVIPHYKAFHDLNNRNDWPVAQKQTSEVITLPIYNGLERTDQDKVIDNLIDIVEKVD